MIARWIAALLLLLFLSAGLPCRASLLNHVGSGAIPPSCGPYVNGITPGDTICVPDLIHTFGTSAAPIDYYYYPVQFTTTDTDGYTYPDPNGNYAISYPGYQFGAGTKMSICGQETVNGQQSYALWLSYSSNIPTHSSSYAGTVIEGIFGRGESGATQELSLCGTPLLYAINNTHTVSHFNLSGACDALVSSDQLEVLPLPGGVPFYEVGSGCGIASGVNDVTLTLDAGAALRDGQSNGGTGAVTLLGNGTTINCAGASILHPSANAEIRIITNAQNTTIAGTSSAPCTLNGQGGEGLDGLETGGNNGAIVTSYVNISFNGNAYPDSGGNLHNEYDSDGGTSCLTCSITHFHDNNFDVLDSGYNWKCRLAVCASSYSRYYMDQAGTEMSADAENACPGFWSSIADVMVFKNSDNYYFYRGNYSNSGDCVGIGWYPAMGALIEGSTFIGDQSSGSGIGAPNGGPIVGCFGVANYAVSGGCYWPTGTGGGVGDYVGQPGGYAIQSGNSGGQISATQASFNVTGTTGLGGVSATDFANTDALLSTGALCSGEIITVTSGIGTGTLGGITRGAYGTTKATHNDGTYWYQCVNSAFQTTVAGGTAMTTTTGTSLVVASAAGITTNTPFDIVAVDVSGSGTGEALNLVNAIGASDTCVLVYESGVPYTIPIPSNFQIHVSGGYDPGAEIVTVTDDQGTCNSTPVTPGTSGYWTLVRAQQGTTAQATSGSAGLFSVNEIMTVTNVAGNTLTIARGAHDTTASSHASGVVVRLMPFFWGFAHNNTFVANDNCTSGGGHADIPIILGGQVVDDGTNTTYCDRPTANTTLEWCDGGSNTTNCAAWPFVPVAQAQMPRDQAVAQAHAKGLCGEGTPNNMIRPCLPSEHLIAANDQRVASNDNSWVPQRPRALVPSGAAVAERGW